jgi:hypothetical protein
MIALGAKVARQPGFRHVGRDGGRIDALPGGGEGALVDIGGENDQLVVPVAPADLLAKEDRERIGLLPRGAARHPDADRLIRLRPLDERHDHLHPQGFPGVGVTKEGGHRDQEVIEKRLDLVRAVAQVAEVGLELGAVVQLSGARCTITT